MKKRPEGICSVKISSLIEYDRLVMFLPILNIEVERDIGALAYSGHYLEVLIAFQFRNILSVFVVNRKIVEGLCRTADLEIYLA